MCCSSMRAARTVASCSTWAPAPSVDEDTGDTIPDTEVPAQLCTQLVEDGGSQLLTFSIVTRSALAETGYRFIVPGVDGAEVEVLVP